MRIPSENGQGLHESQAMQDKGIAEFERWVKKIQAVRTLQEVGFTVEVTDGGKIFTAVKGNATYKLDTAGLLELARLESEDK